MQNLQVYETEKKEKFLCSKEQAEVLDTLRELNHGGIGTVYGYTPTSGYDISPELDLQIITRISVHSLYERKIKALEKIKFEDVVDGLEKNSKLRLLTEDTAEELFNTRKQALIDSMSKTLSGDRNDAMRQGHDRNNITVCQGVKVNLEGDKVDGIKVPTLYATHNSPGKHLPKCESINLLYLEISRTEVKPGKRKEVNSGSPVLMTNLIESLLNKKSVGLKALTLDPSKFKRIVVSKKEITKKDLIDATKDLTMAELILQLLEEYAA